MSNLDALHARAKALKLHGLLAHWTEVANDGWVEALIDWEEQERARRSLARRSSQPPPTIARTTTEIASQMLSWLIISYRVAPLTRS